MVNFLSSFVGWLVMAFCCFSGCVVGYSLGVKHTAVKTVQQSIVIHDTVYVNGKPKYNRGDRFDLKEVNEIWDSIRDVNTKLAQCHIDTIHDTVIKTKRVYIEKESFKSDIPSTILFKKE